MREEGLFYFTASFIYIRSWIAIDHFSENVTGSLQNTSTSQVGNLERDGSKEGQRKREQQDGK